MPEELRLSEGQHTAIIKHVRRNAPEEACGILAGDSDGTVRKVFLMENIEHSPDFYMLDSSEQFKVFKAMENEGMELLAIFHSHPHSAAVPSARDMELAFYPDSLYLIISLAGGAPESHAYSIVGGSVREVRIYLNGD